jgi:hypothetical protein
MNRRDRIKPIPTFLILPGVPNCTSFDDVPAASPSSVNGNSWQIPLKNSIFTEVRKYPGRTGAGAIFGRGGGQIPAPAMWRSLIARSTQSSMNSQQFALPAENFELSDFEFFNGISPNATYVKSAALDTIR